MSQTGIHTMLIVGKPIADQSRFLDAPRQLQSYLVNAVGVDPDAVDFFPAASSSAVEVYTHIQEFFGRAQQQNARLAVLYYRGHGLKGSFYPNGVDGISYLDIGRLFPKDRDFMFINQSCHSGSAIDDFKQLGLLPKHGLVLTSANAEESSCYSIVHRIIPEWMSRRSFRKRKNGYTISEKMVVTFPSSPLLNAAENEERIAVDFDHSTREYPLVKPKVLSDDCVSTFQRCGKNLDYLLFPKILKMRETVLPSLKRRGLEKDGF